MRSAYTVDSHRITHQTFNFSGSSITLTRICFPWIFASLSCTLLFYPPNNFCFRRRFKKLGSTVTSVTTSCSHLHMSTFSPDSAIFSSFLHNVSHEWWIKGEIFKEVKKKKCPSVQARIILDNRFLPNLWELLKTIFLFVLSPLTFEKYAQKTDTDWFLENIS